MVFFNDIRKNITKNKITQGGVRTPIATVSEDNNKLSLLTRITAPAVNLWDKIFSKKDKEDIIKPNPVKGVDVLNTVTKNADLPGEEISKSNWFGKAWLKFQNVFTRKKELKLHDTLSTSEQNTSKLNRVIVQQEEREKYKLDENGLFPVSIKDHTYENVNIYDVPRRLSQSESEEHIYDEITDYELVSKKNGGIDAPRRLSQPESEEHIYDEVTDHAYKLVDAKNNIHYFEEHNDFFVPSLTQPVRKAEKEKVGLIQRTIGSIVDFFTSPFRSKQIATTDNNLTNVNHSWAKTPTSNCFSDDSYYEIPRSFLNNTDTKHLEYPKKAEIVWELNI